MKKRMQIIGLVVAVFLLSWVGYVVCDTTFSWSGPQATGVLTYTGVGLTTPTVNSSTLTSGGTALDAAAGGTTATLTPTLVSNATLKVYGQKLEVIAGGTVTLPADAVSIDALNGITVSAAEINAAGGGSTATLTPTLISNATLKVYGQKLEVIAGGTVTLPADAVSIDALNGITVSAAEINAAGGGTTATLTPTLISNATLKVYGQKLEVIAGGTVTLPSASIASAALPATMSDSTLISNATLKVYGQKLEVVSGGTVTLPVDSVSIDALNGITVTADAINAAANGTSSSVLLSNAVLKVYGSNVEVVAGGTLTVGAGGTVTVPAGSVASASIAAGSMANTMTISNATTKVYGSNVEVVAGGTLITPEATVDGKYAVVGGDASTGLMVQAGTCTNKQATVTYPVAFGAAPKVVLGWVEDVSLYSALTNTCISATSVGTTTFVPKTLVALDGVLTNMQWIAVGQRP